MLITPYSIALRRAYPWSFSIRKILRETQPFRFTTSHLLIGSDYGGHHKGSKYSTYCFLVADFSSPEWMIERRKVRQTYLKDGRRMSFKRLNDKSRKSALVPFLQAADLLNGHLVGIVIDKQFNFLSTHGESVHQISRLFGLRARWNKYAFENMARKAHFFSLLVADWSRPGSDITWLTDEDEFVANESRLDDAQRFAARLSSMYCEHPLGVFAMNSTAIDDGHREFEDFVAIPDLAAGMLSEIASELSRKKRWFRADAMINRDDLNISVKADLIMDWFWFANASLRRTCIMIDKIETKMRVTKLDLREQL